MEIASTICLKLELLVTPFMIFVLPFALRLAHCAVNEYCVYICFSRGRFAGGYRVAHVDSIIKCDCPLIEAFTAHGWLHVSQQ